MDWITQYRSFFVYFHRLSQIMCSLISIRKAIDQGKSIHNIILISLNHFRVRIYGLYNNNGTHEYSMIDAVHINNTLSAITPLVDERLLEICHLTRSDIYCYSADLIRNWFSVLNTVEKIYFDKLYFFWITRITYRLDCWDMKSS